MQKRMIWRQASKALIAVAVLLVGISTGTALAQTSTSPNFQLTEGQFGSSQEFCSDQFCSFVSIGSLSDGSQIASTNASFQDIIDNEPLLDMIIETESSNLGVLSTTTTASKTTLLKVRSYLSGGYSLQMIGPAPSANGYSLQTPSSPTTSTPGTEQFGVNLVENTTPTVGSNPLQLPDNQGSVGVVSANYGLANLFMYQNEDVIAFSEADSSQTEYTLSMIVNVSNDTPAGNYQGDFSVYLIPGY